MAEEWDKLWDNLLLTMALIKQHGVKQDYPDEEAYREFLGENFFKHLEILKTFGAPDEVRIVFAFDN
jgi:hypothetical protein